MKVLMHLCCAPCALYPLQVLTGRGLEVAGYWFNPNIHPLQEYRRRLDSVQRLREIRGLDIYIEDAYGLVEFLRAVAGREAQRCEYCYAVRLEAAARKAREEGFDAFTTSLLVSPYQKSGIIQETGERLQEALGIEFLGEDFSPGFREGRRMAREFDLYRQQYCGCIYSEMERYTGS